MLENRPLVPDAPAGPTMLQPEDAAEAVLFCGTLPPRAVVEELVLSPTLPREQSADLAAARDLGAPEGRESPCFPLPRWGERQGCGKLGVHMRTGALVGAVAHADSEERAGLGDLLRLWAIFYSFRMTAG